MAAAHFLCLTAEGGVPLFYKNTGNLKPLPFPIIGSLNGVHMFGKNHSVNLKSVVTDTSKIIWKEYHHSINLIIVTQDDNASDQHLTSLLDHTFHAMVMLYGLDDLTNIKNVDRFKREIKVSFKLLDTLLDPALSMKCGAVTSAVEVLAGPENTILQSYINAFTEAADSPYGCLMVAGKVAVATSKWWELSAMELVLLSSLMASLPSASARDVAIFLPDNSPTVPHRLLTYDLIPGVEVCVICGPTPTLADLQTEVNRYWQPALDTLKSISRLVPRNHPTALVIDTNILGFLLVNSTSHRCLCSVHPHSPDGSQRQTGTSLTTEERREALFSFYKSTIGSIWPGKKQQDGKVKNKEFYNDMEEKFSQTPTDTYVCTERHKIYAMRSGSHVLYVLYRSTFPTYTMRSVTQKTFHALMKDRTVIV